MIIYGTFSGFKNELDSPNKFKWLKVIDEVGNKIKGIYLSDIEEIFVMLKMKFGNRYMLTFNTINDNFISDITEVKIVNKNPRCDICRKFKNEYHIISGKYKGKKVHEIPNGEMSDYCIWLAKHTYNEKTITNSLNILKEIKE